MKILFVIFLSFLVYLNTLKNDFVWDDTSIIVNNKWIRTPSNFFKFFILKETISEDTRTKPYIYRPLVTFSYSLDYSVWRLSSFGYHLSNIIFHTVTVIFLYILTDLILNNKKISLFSSVIFAVHPVHTEAVSWIKGRADILACMFCMLSFIFYILYFIRNERFIYYFLSLLFFIFGLFSKESAVALVGIIIAYDIIFKKKFLFKSYILFIIVLFLYIILRKSVLGSNLPYRWWAGSQYYTFLTAMKVLVEYFRLLVFPINLCADYVVEISFNVFDLKVIFSILFLIFLITISFISIKRFSIFSFCIFFILISLLPVANIIFPIEVLLAERFLYMPSVGMCLFLGWLVYRILTRNKTLGYVVFVLIVFPYSILTLNRNKDWKDEFNLWSKTAKQFPDNFRAHNNLGMEYEKSGNLEKALYHYKIASNLTPNLSWLHNDKNQTYARVYNNIGNVYFKQKNFNTAIEYYKKAIDLDPLYSSPYFNLGLLYRNKGLLDLAIYYYKKAIELNPYVADYYNNLGVVYALKDDFKEAIIQYEKAVELSSDEDFKKQVLKNIEIAKNFLRRK